MVPMSCQLLFAVVERLPLVAIDKARRIRAIVARSLGATLARAACIGAAGESAMSYRSASRVAHRFHS